MPIKQLNPVTLQPTGVIHPESGASGHVAPTPVTGSHADAAKRRLQVGGPIAPTGPDPMLGAQNTDYFADGVNATAAPLSSRDPQDVA